jgi:hypothetical protein
MEAKPSAKAAQQITQSGAQVNTDTELLRKLEKLIEKSPGDMLEALRDHEQFRALEIIKAIFHARGALSRLLSAQEGWQPIETAPKDGTSILVCGGVYWNDEGGAAIGNHEYPLGVETACWYRDEWYLGYGNGYNYEKWAKPVWWLPLPHPPSEGEAHEIR